MARARNIKPGTMENEQLAELDPLTRLFFVYLWMLADREGRLEDRPKRIKAQALPYDNVDADVMLDELASSGFITRYQIDGERYIQIINFTKHQRPHTNEADSVIPPIPEELATKVESAATQSDKHEEPSQQALRPDCLIDDSLIPDTGLSESESAAPPTPKKPAKSKKVPLPEGFAISERVRRWAAEKGYDRLETHFESFVSKAKAKAYGYADWDEALMGAIRDDWAKLRVQPARASPLSRQSESDRRINEFLNGTLPDDGKTIDMETIR